MPVSFPRPGEALPYDLLPLSIRLDLIPATSNSLIGGFVPERGTIEVYRVRLGGQHGYAEFLGYLSPTPVVAKRTESGVA